MANRNVHEQELVRTAMRLFRRQGYAATGLQQILAESGAPRGSLYHYFPEGKESIGAAAVEMAGEIVAETLRELAVKHRDAATFVAAYCRLYAKWMEESGYRSGCPIATTLLENAPRSKAITEAGRAAFRNWVEVIAPVLERDGIDGKSARERAQGLVAALEGALIVARVEQSKKPILALARAFASPQNSRSDRAPASKRRSR